MCGFSCDTTHECSCEALLASSVLAFERSALGAGDELGRRLDDVVAVIMEGRA